MFHILIGLLMSATAVNAQFTPRNYLFNEFQAKGGSATIDVEKWRKEKLKSLQENITSLSDTEKTILIKNANDVLKTDWEVLKISDYLKFNNNASINRRIRLGQLVMAELAENKGTYFPEIVNGLWLTLEEATWVLPEHIKLQKAGKGLPDPNEIVIDLRSGDISSMVSWIRFLFYDKLKKISPLLIDRIDYELERRTIRPFLERDDLHWMGFEGKRHINNWNIWINTNVLLTAVLAIDDADKRNKVIDKAIRSADKFVNGYPNDGGCDEGVTYWMHAGGRLIQFIKILTEMSDNKLDWSKNALVHEIGTYIYKVHVDSGRFVNFADASAIPVTMPSAIYTYGKLFNDKNLTQFAAYLYDMENTDIENKRMFKDLNVFIETLNTNLDLKVEKPRAPLLKQSWLPDLQVAALRQEEGSTKGLFFAAKGGHNAESHNHNDIGNFVLYLDGQPVIIDAGVDGYNQRTFSKDRYTLWYMQSAWHNCPSINGVQQKNGKQYAAKEVKYSNRNGVSTFSMDITSAYPSEADVLKWKREFVFSGKNGSLELNENYALREFRKPFDLHFLTSLSVKELKQGLLVFSDNKTKVFMHYDPQLFDVLIEEKMLKKGKLFNVWGDQVRRLTLRSKISDLQGQHQIAFTTSQTVKNKP